MKKLLVVLAILSLAACENGPEMNTGEHIPWQHVTRFSYSGHRYIKFHNYSSAGVVHDPDCECMKDQR